MLVKMLRRIDLATLRKLAGETILSAIEAIKPTNMEKEIAEVLLLKYSTQILKNKEIREGIIDTLPVDKINDICAKLRIHGKNQIDKYNLVRKHFRIWGDKRSREFVDLLQLDSKYYLKPEIDLREGCELISIDINDQVRLKPYLHDYQKRVKDEIIEYLSQTGNRFIVQMPTGAGKTYTALEAVVDVLRLPRQEKYVVWIVDSNELAEQALGSFKNLWTLKGDHSIYLFRLFKSFTPDFSEHKGGIVFASFSEFYSIISNHRHQAYDSLWHLIRNTDLLIVDEAHTSVAETYEKCIRTFTQNSDTKVFGLSATPGRSSPESTKELVGLYSKKIIPIRNESRQDIADAIGYLQGQSYLANLNAEVLQTGIEATERDEGKLLKTLSKNGKRNNDILKQIERAHRAKESSLVFACTLDHVYALHILCNAKGIPSEFIVGGTEQITRLEILERFKKREFYILINLDLLSQGIDIPNINKIIITRPIGSMILYSQIIGRALRGPRNGGNRQNIIVNIEDNLRNFPTANFVYTIFKADWHAKEI